jgi:hypothetical protein
MHLYLSNKHTTGVCHFAALCAAIAFGLGCPRSQAAPPLLEFDVPFSIACRSLPLKGTAPNEPEKELIEVVIPISARLQSGDEKDLKQCLYTLVDPTKPETLWVTDLLPRTELKSEFAKPIQVSSERLAKIGINLSAHYVVAAAGEAAGQVKSDVAYEMLPPQEIVLASGTLAHAHGVFFKLKPSSQTTLEGVKSFSVISRCRAAGAAAASSSSVRRWASTTASRNRSTAKRAVVWRSFTWPCTWRATPRRRSSRTRWQRANKRFSSRSRGSGRRHRVSVPFRTWLGWEYGRGIRFEPRRKAARYRRLPKQLF